MVCPYSLDAPGGVQAHVLDLARALRSAGHAVEVLAPAGPDTPVPPFVTRAGRALSVPYNGSVARVRFGPVSWTRARRWLDTHEFDVLHLHEPTTVSLSVLTLLVARGPIVATFHTATDRSRALSAMGGVLRPLMEKVTARIAVSPTARAVQVRHLGGDAVEIPNGVDVARFAQGPVLDVPGETVGFVGRFDEPRKGMPLLLDALCGLAPARPGLRLLVVGRGDAAALRRAAGPWADRLDVLGPVDDATKAAALRSVRVLCAPHLRGESFGMVLTEAMAAGAPVLAADLDAFRAVLGPAGALFPAGDAPALARSLAALLDDAPRRAALAAAGRERAAAFDWSVVAADVVRVYRAALAAAPRQRAG
ncbi:glycosyltransferase family 4 protein [Pseudonocardia hydrocarbonoxydans]|uniref:GDP-mannose-dependent alpha-(1-2)-phosphatidylinositol mannosyltransferase n=2 Tax=Pseudonocardia hydrocarbonoxydans TaxID=76726 RepID=A0A4Y3WFE2_9PSEU|nr:GDP-mannose-dependent alpha-(1-2)-phosphatidylinositol mannosyltransferase [Pseudonocardia hydrocarbonoxydans]